MPIYGYRCDQCGHELEVLQSISEDPLKVCPVCMGPLRKLFYPAGIIYKGSGYYSTDYKGSGSGGAGNKAASSSDSTSSSGSEPAAKTESKPASSEAAKPSGGAKKSDD